MDSAGNNLLASDGLGLRIRVVPRLPIGRKGQPQQQEQAQDEERTEHGESNNESPEAEYATPRGQASQGYSVLDLRVPTDEKLTKWRATRQATEELLQRVRNDRLRMQAEAMTPPPPNNSGQASIPSFRPGLSTMEFQGSSRPSSPLRRELNLGSPEGERNDRRTTYYNLEAEATPVIRVVNPGMAIRLEPFDGTDSRWWISTADAYYDESNYNDEQRLRKVRYYLKGDAGAYWLGLQEEAPEWRPNTWEEFKEMMRKTFHTRDPISLIRELQNMQYRGDFNDYEQWG
ncbi:hypothetical protein Emag_005328 [Eimeria magna]